MSQTFDPAAAGPAITPPGRPSLFVLSTDDPDGAAGFYRQVLGWRLQPVSGFPPAAESGGQTCIVRQGPVGWLPFLAVADVAAVVARARGAGGRAVHPLPDDATGRSASIFDPTDTRLGVYQPDRLPDGASAAPLGGGDIVWMEQKTRDQGGATEFLRAVFGFQAVGSTGPGKVRLLTGNPGPRYAGVMQFDQRWAPDYPAHWLLYASVTDVGRTLALAVEHGGSVWFPVTDTPMGPIAYFRDPAGHALAIVQVSEAAAASLLSA